MAPIGGLILLGVLFSLYFLPSAIAYKRKHKNLNGIIILNIFLGWTILGWLGALIWAVAN